MLIGVPKEIKPQENRVGLTADSVKRLVTEGNKVVVETGAGNGSGFTDQDYISAGASIYNSAKEIFDNSEMIIKVKEPQKEEVELLKKDQLLFTYLHLAANKELTLGLMNSGSACIAYETVTDENNRLPLLAPMSEVAGRMSIQNGAKCLESNMGGMGKLLSGVPGVEPATVTILGGGIVGMNAAKLASGLGAKVYILDVNPSRLKYLDEIMSSNVFTLYSNNHTIIEMLPKTDLLIGSVLVVGDKAPNLIKKSMLTLMKKGSVIVDVAVDQGGCVETCKPTTHANPTYEIDGIVHYCVANMPGAVPFTSTTALANTTYPYIKNIANNGYIKAFTNDASLLKGLNIFKGIITHKGVSNAFNKNYVDPLTAIQN